MNTFCGCKNEMILNNYPQRSIDLLCCLILLRRNATQRGHFVNIFFDVHQTQRPLATHKACQGDVAAKGKWRVRTSASREKRNRH